MVKFMTGVIAMMALLSLTLGKYQWDHPAQAKPADDAEVYEFTDVDFLFNSSPGTKTLTFHGGWKPLSLSHGSLIVYRRVR